MSTFFTDIRAALETRLAALSGVPTIIHENVRGDSDVATTHFRCYMLFGDTTRASSGKDRTDGVFQVSVFVPHGDGQTTWPDLIADHMKRGDAFTQNDATVRIENTSVGPAIQDDHYYIVPVSVRWRAHTALRT